MFVIKRNQVILTALVMMIAVAGYLNFTESRGSETTASTLLSDESDAYTALLPPEGDIETIADDMEGAEATADAATPTSSDAVALDPITAEVSNTVDDTGAAIFVSTSTDAKGNAYFVQAKLEREQARSKEKDILTELINNDNLDKDQKADYANSMLELQKRIEKETAAEAMIESKGFSDAYVRIDDETVDVVVDKETLSEQDLAQIMDIVKRKTGVQESSIRISTLKK